jgi:hypothetical protein
MAQVFDRSSNALARMSLVLTGLIVIALGVALNSLQRSLGHHRPTAGPADSVQPQAPRRGLGLQCRVLPYAGGEGSIRGHSSDEDRINCHADLTNADYLEPVRQSWATGASISGPCA